MNANFNWFLDPGVGSTLPAETDDDLRRRIRYVADETPRDVQRIEHASGEQLDEIADEYGLKRRYVS